MNRSIRGLFVSFIFFYIVFIISVCSAEEFISPEKAFESLSGFPEIKFLAVKYLCDNFECAGHGFGTSVERWPEKDYPFYVLRYDITEDVEKEPGLYLAKEIYAKLFYIDAYTAKVYPGDITQETILEKKAAAKARDIEKSILVDKEIDLKVALERISKGLEGRVSLPDEECKNLAREFSPLFFGSVNALTPETRLKGIMILKRLGDISKSCAEFKDKQIIQALIKLFKDNDYRVRYSAVNALLVTGEKGDSLLIEELRVLLKDPNKLVKKAAVKAIAKLGNSKPVK